MRASQALAYLGTRSVNLFDDLDRVQTGTVPNVYSGFVLLNRDDSSGSQCLRDRLESWFEKFPASSKKDVRERFRSTNPETHEGALFELFLHELITRLGCTVNVHPEVTGSDNRPDFLVCHGSKRVYLEATAVGQRDGPFTPNNNEQDAIDKLRTLCSPNFNLRIEMVGTLSRTLGRRHLVPRFAELLARHDPDTVLKLTDTGGLDSAPSAKYEADEWSIEAWLLPISSRSRRNDQTRRITVMPRRAKRTDSVQPVRNAAKKKSTKYGHPDLPLVVAVHTRDKFYNGHDCDLDVLYGDEQFTYSHETSRVVRKPNGIWSGDDGRRISAFLRCQRVDAWNLSRAGVCLYIDPRQDYATLPDALFRLPHGKVSKDIMTWSEGEDIAQLLDTNSC